MGGVYIVMFGLQTWIIVVKIGWCLVCVFVWCITLSSKEGRCHWTINYTGTQSFITTLSHSFTQNSSRFQTVSYFVFFWGGGSLGWFFLDGWWYTPLNRQRDTHRSCYFLKTVYDSKNNNYLSPRIIVSFPRILNWKI